MYVSSFISWSWQSKENIHWTLEICSLHQNSAALPSCCSMNVTDFGILKQDSASGCQNPAKQKCCISVSVLPLYLTQLSLGLENHPFITSPKAPSEKPWDNHSSPDSRDLRRQESLAAALVWGWLWIPKSAPAALWRGDRARYGMRFLRYFSYRADTIGSDSLPALESWIVLKLWLSPHRLTAPFCRGEGLITLISANWWVSQCEEQ